MLFLQICKRGVLFLRVYELFRLGLHNVMWQSILFSNNDLIFLRSLDSERRKRQHLKNQVQWYGRRECKHLSVPTTCESECSSRCSVSDIMPYAYTKQAFRKDDRVERLPMTFGSLHRKRKAPEVSPRQCVRDRPRKQTRNSFERTLSVETSCSINDSPTATPDFS